MPKIENRIFQNEPLYRYSELLKELAGSPVASGLSIAEIRERTNLMDKLEKISKSDDNFLLSKEEIEVAKTIIKKTTWSKAGRNVIDFIDYIEGLK